MACSSWNGYEDRGKRAIDSLISFLSLYFQIKMQEAITYPLSAIVALDDLKLALILNAINPKIGGLLIRGPKGSGKTTAVRALADILPKIRVVTNCPFNCNPDDPSNMCDKCRSLYMKDGNLPFEETKMRVVDLPLGATEDRVVGSLDVEKAIKIGVEALEPGILAQANQNILYVDEVNLLPDHITDDLLDAATSGWNIVEREGISVKHPSRFIFIGTMNPEEGHLRPQILDRFALSVEVNKILDVGDRIEIVKRNMEFEADPEGFVKKNRSDQDKLRDKIIQARKVLPAVMIHDKLIEVVCEACLELKVDGMRPDIVIAKTAKTLAALENKTAVAPEHMIKAAKLALNHRTREGGFLEPATPQEIKRTLNAKIVEKNFSDENKGRTTQKSKGKKENEEPSLSKKKGRIFLNPLGLRRFLGKEAFIKPAKTQKDTAVENFSVGDGSSGNARFLHDFKPEKGGKAALFTAETTWGPPNLTSGTPLVDKIRESKLLPFKYLFKTKDTSRHAASSVGKRAEAISTIHRGKVRGWKIPYGRPSDIYLPATIRTAARLQRFRKKPANTALAICVEDVKEKLRVYRAPMTIVFLLDLSESMLSSIKDIKEALLKLHNDAYRFRDKVGLVAFKEMGAVVAHHPTTNLKLVSNTLLRLGMGGYTPLADGMLKALDVLKESKRRDLSTIPVMVVITDGETNVPFRKDLQTGEIREINAIDVAFFKYENEAIKDVVTVSEMIKREGIYTVVINIAPASIGPSGSSGIATTKMIASITGGMYYESSGNTGKNREPSSGEISEAILQAQKNISHFHYLTNKTRIK
jgi:magnesium chelatase subunit D